MNIGFVSLLMIVHYAIFFLHLCFIPLSFPHKVFKEAIEFLLLAYLGLIY